MTAASLVTDFQGPGQDLPPQPYLRAVIAVARSARRGEYVVFHFGMGHFLRTDWLGAMAMRSMIDGRSAGEAMKLVDEIEAGAGERARRLIDTLGQSGALSLASPSQANGRWRIRRWVARIAGWVFSALGSLAQPAPTWALGVALHVLPSTPIVGHVWRSRRSTILYHMRATGYSARPDTWMFRVGRDSAASTPLNSFFSYLALSLPPAKLDRLVYRLFDRQSTDDLASRLHATGATVGVFLHDALYAPVPNALRLRGIDVVRTVAGRWHGINVSESSGRLSYFFGDSPEMTVDTTDPLASALLVRHLKAGRSVHVALDRAAGERRTAKIEMLGQRFSRNDGPAWLAVRSGRPLALWTTHHSASGAVITSSPPLYPESALPVELRVADLSERLYAYAEAAIRRHPESWACWNYLHEIKGRVT